MLKAIVTVALFSAAFAACAAAQVPPRYEIVQLTENAYYEHRPAINNRGQIVFARRLGANEFSDEIFLYDDGEFIQLTDDDVQDMCPDINDEGTIVWSRRIGADDIYGPTLEVFVWQDGQVTRLTDDDRNDYVGGINNLGHIVWSKIVRGGCHNVNAVICFYDGATVEQISHADWSNASPAINDQDWVVWTRYNFCDNPWTSDIMLCVDGDTIQLTNGQVCPQMPSINNRGQVAWTFRDTDTGLKAIQIWQDAETALLTDWGLNPRLNDYGDVYFIRWYEDPAVYQAWVYLKERFFQLSDDPFWNVDCDINNLGEAVWHSGPPPGGYDIRLLRRLAPDGVNAGDEVDVLEARPLRP